MATSSLERLLSLSCDAIGELRSVLMLIDRDEPHHLEARRALDMTRDWHEHLAEEDYGYLARHFPQPEPDAKVLDALADDFECDFHCEPFWNETEEDGSPTASAINAARNTFLTYARRAIEETQPQPEPAPPKEIDLMRVLKDHLAEQTQPEPEGGAEEIADNWLKSTRIIFSDRQQDVRRTSLANLIRAARAAGAREAQYWKDRWTEDLRTVKHESREAAEQMADKIAAAQKRAEALEGLLGRMSTAWKDVVVDADEIITEVDAALEESPDGASD